MKDWKTWVLLIGVFFLVKTCGGCEGCGGCSNDDGMRTCQRCGKTFEPRFEDDKWCQRCYSEHSKKFNENWEKREKALPVRPY